VIAAGWIAAGIAAVLAVVLGGLALFSAWTARQVERRVPPRGRFIDIDGARIHYLDEGTGPPLLLIHGLSGQMHNFTHSLLGRLTRHHRVVILDRPGSGYSTRAPGASAAIAVQARTIARFAQELGLARPLVVGHSLGGAIALSLALDHPGVVGGLALMAPVTHPQPRVPQPFQRLAVRSPLVRALIAWTLAVPMSIASRKHVLDVLFGSQPAPADFAIRGGALLALRPSSFFGASSDLVAAADDLTAMPARYRELAMPVGILYGTADRILDPAVHGEAFAAKLPGVDFELIEDGSHMILISSADRAAAFIARMAQRVATADAAPAPVA